MMTRCVNSLTNKHFIDPATTAWRSRVKHHKFDFDNYLPLKTMNMISYLLSAMFMGITITRNKCSSARFKATKSPPIKVGKEKKT